MSTPGHRHDSHDSHGHFHKPALRRSPLRRPSGGEGGSDSPQAKSEPGLRHAEAASAAQAGEVEQSTVHGLNPRPILEVRPSHDHAPHGHTHEHLDHAGHFHERDLPLDRDFRRRAFTVGVGGPVGSGKTALMLQLCRKLRTTLSIAAVTNDIFTKEDGEFLTTHQALEAERIRAVETGGCPHAAIREDISANLIALEDLHEKFQPDILLLESGGDNLAACFSRELADYTIQVIDVCGGDKIPRKGGPGITQSDLLVINKTDLATGVGADLAVMERDSRKMRGSGPFVMAQVKHGVGVDAIVAHILHAWQHATGVAHSH